MWTLSKHLAVVGVVMRRHSSGANLRVPRLPPRDLRKLRLVLETADHRYIDYTPQATAAVRPPRPLHSTPHHSTPLYTAQ